MLDLDSDDFKLNETSGLAKSATISLPHQPILRQGSHQWDYRESDAGGRILRYPRFGGRHLILDLPVPQQLYEHVAPIRTGLQQRSHEHQYNEFTHLRYTPVFCDPTSFTENDYLLRPDFFAKPRQIEVCIAVTMYNEDQYLLGSTLAALHKNIEALQDPACPEPWGPGSWRKIVICIISDGREKMNPCTKALLASMGLFQEVGLIERDQSQDVVAHLFEYTTHSTIRTSTGQVFLEHGSSSAVLCQTILCLKEKNQRKLNSHRWFLEAICGSLSPKIAVFLDAGAVPQPNSLRNLCEPFYRNESVAAAIGFCTGITFRPLGRYANPLSGFQIVEYQLSNSLERPIESLFGRRFSKGKGGLTAYRYSIATVTNDGMRAGGLFEEYLDGETINLEPGSITKMNSFLAEDRIISSTLLSLGRKTWRTVAVDSAEVRTNMPDTFAEFCLQRRRWINGDLYCTLREIRNLPSYLKLSERRVTNSPFRTIGLLVGATYQVVNLALQFFAVGNSFTIFYIITASLSDDAYLGTPGHWACLALSYVYVLVFMAGLIWSMGHRPTGTPVFAYLTWAWTLIYTYLFAVLLYLSVHGSRIILALSRESRNVFVTGPLFLDLVLPLVTIFGIWMIAPPTLGRRPHSLTSIVWYLVFLPMYVNLVNTYAWCNVHDFAWGNKGSDVTPDVGLVRLERDGRERGNISMRKTFDPETGDLVIHDIDGYLGQLDSYWTAQPKQYEAVSESYSTPKDKRHPFMGWEKTFRTISLLCWLGLNGALVTVVLSIPRISRFVPTAAGGTGLEYVGAVLWAYAGVSLFQYACTVLYALSKLWAAGRRLVRKAKQSSVVDTEVA